MQSTLALAALAAVAYALPQTDGSGAVIGPIAPAGAPPAGAVLTYPGAFQLTVVKATAAKRDVEKRQSTCGQAGTLTVTLTNGVLLDSQKRTGYIASNYQFQFDGPPQAGALYTAGFSVLGNTSLALGPTAVFWSCLSGGFSNLYDRNWAPQCIPVLLDIVPCSGTPAPGLSQIPDGQPQATGTPGTATPPKVTQISDGQVQATSPGAPPKATVTQISDGQVQIPSVVPKPPVLSQIGDGQVQVVTPLPPTTTAKPVISQIGDGQVQVGTPLPPATTAKPVVSQIPDGQIQVNGTVPKPPLQVTGAANSLTVISSFATVFVGLAAMILL